MIASPTARLKPVDANGMAKHMTRGGSEVRCGGGRPNGG